MKLALIKGPMSRTATIWGFSTPLLLGDDEEGIHSVLFCPGLYLTQNLYNVTIQPVQLYECK